MGGYTSKGNREEFPSPPRPCRCLGMKMVHDGVCIRCGRDAVAPALPRAALPKSGRPAGGTG